MTNPSQALEQLIEKWRDWAGQDPKSPVLKGTPSARLAVGFCADELAALLPTIAAEFEELEREALKPRGLANCHIVPKQSDIEANRRKEPEGERIRQELIDFLERNKICGILMDTPHHHVDIQYCPLLPDEIRNVLRLWGSIYVVVKERAALEAKQPGARKEEGK